MSFLTEKEWRDFMLQAMFLFVFGILNGIFIEYIGSYIAYLDLSRETQRRAQGLFGFILSTLGIFLYIRVAKNIPRGTDLAVFYITGLFNVQAFTERLVPNIL